MSCAYTYDLKVVSRGGCRAFVIIIARYNTVGTLSSPLAHARNEKSSLDNIIYTAVCVCVRNFRPVELRKILRTNNKSTPASRSERSWAISRRARYYRGDIRGTATLKRPVEIVLIRWVRELACAYLTCAYITRHGCGIRILKCRSRLRAVVNYPFT